jgi:hypothetical protein
MDGGESLGFCSGSGTWRGEVLVGAGLGGEEHRFEGWARVVVASVGVAGIRGRGRGSEEGRHPTG